MARTSNKSTSSKSTISTSTTSYATIFSDSTVGDNGASINIKSPPPSQSHKRTPNFSLFESPSSSSKSKSTAEYRSPTINSKHINDNMARVVDHSGAFPQMSLPDAVSGGATSGANNNNITSPQQHQYKKSTSIGSGNSAESGSRGGGSTANQQHQQSSIPQSPHRTYHTNNKNQSSPVSQQQQVNLTPKLRSITQSLSAASIGSVINNSSSGPGIPRTPSRDQFTATHNNSSNNTVASNNSNNNNHGRSNTPTRHITTHRRNPTGSDEDKKSLGSISSSYGIGGEQYDDNATYMSHHTNATHGSTVSAGQHRFISTPQSSASALNNAFSSSTSGGVERERDRGMGGNSSVATNGTTSVSSISSARYASSVGPTPSHESSSSQQQQRMNKHGIDMNIHDSVKQKGIAKRKRKEYAKDSRYTPVRRVVDELNKAIGPEKRRSAIDRACIEFDHSNELQHNAELYLGAANVLCLVLSMSEQDDEIQSTCAALEMVYRAEREAVIISYQDVGAALVPLLLRLLERYEKDGRKVMSSEGTISNISLILLHMTRISELRVPLVGHPGMLAALERVATLPLSMENRILRMRLLANLANSEGNKVTIFERGTLMEATMKVATLDKAESAREYASAVLMDLSSCASNQVPMARMDKVLATLVKLAVVEDKVETREYAVSGLQNLAFEKKNRMQLVSYGSGVVIEALKKCTISDSNDKTRRRSAGALTNLACDETAEKMATHAGLFECLAQASVSDKNKDAQQRATLALTKLANSITVKMSCWGTLLDALITASQCTVADGIVSAMFRVKTRAEENRTSMANHPNLLETLAQLCLRTKDSVENEKVANKDCENATKAIAHLSNDPLNHKLICNKHILAALVHGASLAGKAGMITRDASILAMERLAMEHSNRPMMARFPGMLVSIAKATEREMNEELNGIPVSSVTGQPRLAKPLLMSLLVAM